MLTNYLKTALRNILRQKGYSFINILGLSIGLGAAILILLWVVNELSYNRHNENFHEIYRVIQKQQYSSGPLITSSMPAPLAADLKADFPGLTDVFRYFTPSAVLSVGDNNFAEVVSMADSGLFNVFSFQFIAGSPSTALRSNTAILSEKGVKKYFGDEDPMGKVIRLNDELNFRVNGIVKDPPENSSFTSEIYLPFHHLEEMGYNLSMYGWNSYSIFVQTRQDADIGALNQKLRHYFRKVRNDETITTEISLFPLQKERLYSYSGKPLLITNIYIFSLIAAFILLLACINFMNLSTARAAKRSREIGLRKVSGAGRHQLIIQFLSESILMSLLGLAIALLLVELTLPVFNELTARELSLNLFDPVVAGTLLLLAIVTGFIAGSYPAFYLSGLKPLKNIRTAGGSSTVNIWFRRTLVVFQFVLSIGLIICTIVILKQIEYIHNKDLGMNKENVIFVRLRGDLSEKFYDFKSKLLQNPDIISATRSSHLPYYVGSNSGGLIWEGKENDDDVLIGFARGDYNYLETMQMELVAGRFFDKSYSNDTLSVVVNEAAVKTMEMKNPVGKWIGFKDDRDRLKIIGVVKDFNFLPLDTEIKPLAFFYSATNYNFMLIRVNGLHTSEAIAYIENLWGQYLPSFPFEFRFMDDYYETLYTNVSRLGKLIKYFAILAIIISCLGLLGLASFTAEQRTKEIGIRKVLGSSVSGIIALQQKEFFWLVVAANLISWPLAWYFMSDWLNTYVYKIHFSPMFFVVAGGLSLAITFLTVLILSYRAAIKNPVDAIKNE